MLIQCSNNVRRLKQDLYMATMHEMFPYQCTRPAVVCGNLHNVNHSMQHIEAATKEETFHMGAHGQQYYSPINIQSVTLIF